ncbi:hypothetical protein H4R35_004076 [Dimargaris xerosporica]|nr:hypothetical protein H4R35_004076 [Dimargaris xerosporica]
MTKGAASDPWFIRLRNHLQQLPVQITCHELLRTVLALAYFFVVIFGMTMAQQVADERWEQSDPKLRDMGFEWLPLVDQVEVMDAVVTLALVLCVVGNLAWLTHWGHRLVFVRRWLWLVGTLYLFRAITIMVTTVPSPRDCVPPIGHTAEEKMLIAVQMIFANKKACADNIYSGHTVMLVSCFLLWRVHARHRWLVLYSLLHTLAGVALILLSHLHYTVDILIAVFFTYGVFSVYFHALDIASHNHRRFTSHRLKCQCPPKASVPGSALAPRPWHRPLGAWLPGRRLDATVAQHPHGPNTPSRTYSCFDLTQPARPSPILPMSAVDEDAEVRAIAVTPRTLNHELVGLVSWLDGLDLRSPYQRPRRVIGACPLHVPKPMTVVVGPR